jgi:thiamine biosynthesis lipoprotein
MRRRDFLRPRILGEAAGHFQLFDGGVATAEPSETALVRFGRRAMATTFEVVLPYGSSKAVARAESALDEIDRLESQLTVYQESSEVSRLNQLASQVEVPVEDGLFELLSRASQLSSETEGAFDVSAGALIKAWGFYRGPARVPSDDEIHSARERVGMNHVVLNRHKRTVRFLRPGIEINLGSIGKGYALDRAAWMLRQTWTVSSALVHGGHSSVYAIGAAPGATRGWEVGIRHPWDQGQRLAVLRLRDRALGTSAATFKHLNHRGRKLGHILDPRTGWPAQGVASASVVAASAAEADALATAFYILGVEQARAYCEGHPNIGAVILPEGRGARPVVIGISPQDIALCSL